MAHKSSAQARVAPADAYARPASNHTCCSVEGAVLVHDVDGWQAHTATNLIIIGVVTCSGTAHRAIASSYNATSSSHDDASVSGAVCGCVCVHACGWLTRSDFEGACSKLHVHIVVSNDRDGAAS